MTVLSIVVVTRNRPESLSGCIARLNGLVEECGPDMVRYIIQDGSSNSEVNNEFNALFGSYESESDSGIYNAMNKAFRHSNSEFIMFIGDDDIIRTDNMLAALGIIADNIGNYDAFIFPVAVKSPSSVRIWQIDERLRRWSMPFPHGGFIVSSAYHKQIGGFDEKYTLSSDYDYALRLLSSDPSICINSSIGPIVDFPLGGASSRFSAICENLLIRYRNNVHPFNIMRGFVYDFYRYLSNTKARQSRGF